MANSTLRRENIARLRRSAAAFVGAAEQFKAALEEAEYLGLLLPSTDGGLSTTDFVGADEGITPEDMLAMIGVMSALLTPMTLQQRQAVYKVKAASGVLPFSSPMGMTGP